MTKFSEDNIKNTFLNPSSALFEEPENLLKQEVREPALYNAIIMAIATGASRMSEISGKVGESNLIIARGAADLAYKRIEPHLSDYMGKVFEEICKQYLWQLLLSGECPVEFSTLGRWWGNDPKEKRQAEIDILAEQDKNTALFGECKWTNEKVDLGVLETLVKRSELFPYKNVHYYLFAKTGFTKGCLERAKEMGNVELVAYRDIVDR
ncbi:MAG: DUF234 domain-containing protein [Anaerovoracaceae bacterium]|nr:DUF234 domain-containing protein [Anaerovoracaceae bacterium]